MKRPRSPKRPAKARRARRRPDLITRAELARRKGCSPAAVTQACRGVLAPACVGTGVDVGHLVVRDWLLSSPRGPSSQKSKASHTPAVRAELEELTLRRRRAEVQRLEHKNELLRGRLIEREFVRQHVLGVFGALWQRLLREMPGTLVSRALAPKLSREERVRVVHDLLGAALRAAKAQATHAISEAPSPENPRPVADPIDPAPDPLAQALRVFTLDLHETLVTRAAPTIVTMLWKDVARSGSKNFDAEAFQRVMTASADLQADATRRTASMLEAHIRRALTSSQREEEPSHD